MRLGEGARLRVGEERAQHSRHQPLRSGAEPLGLIERVRLTRACLAVGDERAVVAVEHRAHERLAELPVHACIVRFAIEDMVEAEAAAICERDGVRLWRSLNGQHRHARRVRQHTDVHLHHVVVVWR